MIQQQERSFLEPTIYNVFGSLITKVIMPKTENAIDMVGYQIVYTKHKNSLDWEPMRKKMFEFGPYSYPICKTIFDSFESNQARRDFCNNRKVEHPIVIEVFSKNKLFHERVNCVIKYTELYIEKDCTVTSLLMKIKELYDYESGNGRIDLQNMSETEKIQLTEIITELALFVVKTEIKNLKPKPAFFQLN